MDNILLSVVVPVYNAAEYLEMCIESIIAQTYKNLEIILIDDGSTDGSGEICDRYENMDKRIRVFHNVQSGVVRAREIGVELTQGDYITFVDSDDWIEPDYYDVFISHAVHGYDVICAGLVVEEMTGEKTIEDVYLTPGLYQGEQIQKQLVPQMFCDSNSFRQNLSPCMYNKVFKKQVLKEYYKKVNKSITMGEDAIVSYIVIALASSVYIITGKTKYHYRKNPNSMTGKFNSTYYKCIQLFSENVDHILNESGLENMQKQFDLYKWYLYKRKLQVDCRMINNLMVVRKVITEPVVRDLLLRLEIKNMDAEKQDIFIIKAFKKNRVFGVYIMLKLLCVKRKIHSMIKRE